MIGITSRNNTDCYIADTNDPIDAMIDDCMSISREAINDFVGSLSDKAMEYLKSRLNAIENTDYYKTFEDLLFDFFVWCWGA